jgi:hypothetical protein
MCFKQIAKELHIELVVLHDQDGFCHPAPPTPGDTNLEGEAPKAAQPVKK